MGNISYRVVSFDDAKALRSRAAKERVAFEDTRDTTWFGAFEDGQLVGVGAVFLLRPGRARLKADFVHPDHRCAGIGSALRIQREAFCEEQGCSCVEAYAWDPRTWLAKGYRAIGKNAHGATRVERAL